MEIAARRQFARFLVELRSAYRVTFVALKAAEERRRDDIKLFGSTFVAGFIVTSLFIA